jgi:hypothetical protein
MVKVTMHGDDVHGDDGDDDDGDDVHGDDGDDNGVMIKSGVVGYVTNEFGIRLWYYTSQETINLIIMILD